MKKLLIVLGLFFASCTSVPFPDPEEPAFIAPMQTSISETEPFFATVEAILATRTAEVEAGISTPVPTLEPGCMAEILNGEFRGIVCEAEGPFVQRTNWLLLGGDYRAHREGTDFGNKTDVIVLVSILETDPMDIAVIQFPRNLYLPVEGIDDQWLFAVWGREGWQGLHSYFQRAFGISLQGIHYVNMDSFVKVVDDLGGIRVNDSGGAYQLGGEDTLSYLRDNENNWGMGSYDAQERVFKVLAALWVRGGTFLLEDPRAAANIVYSQWGDLFETDLSNIEQLYWLFTLGWKVRNADKDFRFIQLEEPFIERGDTPIYQDEKPMRGMIATLDLREWMQDCVIDQMCEADPDG